LDVSFTLLGSCDCLRKSHKFIVGLVVLVTIWVIIVFDGLYIYQ
jgi:hypothetical protein